MHYYFFAAASASLPRRFVSPETNFICSSCIISACFLSSYSFFVFFSFLCIIHVHFKKSINWVAPVVRWCFLFPFLSPDFPSSLGKSPSIKFSELGYWILNISLYSFRRNFDLSLFQEHTEVVTSLLGFVSSTKLEKILKKNSVAPTTDFKKFWSAYKQNLYCHCIVCKT